MRSKKKIPAPSLTNDVGAKRNDPKRSLAEHAIVALARLGYAQTSLRDIAKCSGLSVGIVHYHFKDKVELISYCTQLYKEEFVREIDAATSLARTPDGVIKAFIEGAVASIESGDTAQKHRLWYDIRAQAMFDKRFQSAANEIEIALIGLSERIGARLMQTGARGLNLTATQFYLAGDGFIRFYLQRQLAKDPLAGSDLRKALQTLFKLAVDYPETKRQVPPRGKSRVRKVT